MQLGDSIRPAPRLWSGLAFPSIQNTRQSERMCPPQQRVSRAPYPDAVILLCSEL